MRHETRFATVENVVTAICFGVGALLVVLALYTLVAVKTVNAGIYPLSHDVAVPAETATEMLSGISIGYRSAGRVYRPARNAVQV